MNNNELLDPEDAEEPQDNTLALEVVAPPKMVITPKEAAKAARAAGMGIVSAKKILAVAQIGQWVEQCGATKIGYGMFAFTAEKLQEGIQKCADLDKEIPDPQVRASILAVSRDLTEQYIDIAKALVKGADKSPAQSQPPAAQVPGPPPGMAITVQKGGAVQINGANTPPTQ